MAGVKLTNISALLGEETTIDSFIDMLPGDNPATGYDYLLFPDSLAYAKRIQSKKLEERFAVENACFARREAFGNLTQAFTMSLMAFLAIAAVGVAFIIGMSAFSVFMRQRKENATLLSLGARGEDIQLIYLRENLVISLIGAVFALVLSYPASQLVNQYLGKRFGLHGLISIPIVRFYGVPFLLPILVIATAGFLSTLATFIPLHFMKNAPVAEVLRDE
jgi:ABC-type lipoprotein release transport system permease subunit